MMFREKHYFKISDIVLDLHKQGKAKNEIYWILCEEFKHLNPSTILDIVNYALNSK